MIKLLCSGLRLKKKIYIYVDGVLKYDRISYFVFSIFLISNAGGECEKDLCLLKKNETKSCLLVYNTILENLLYFKNFFILF